MIHVHVNPLTVTLVTYEPEISFIITVFNIQDMHVNALNNLLCIIEANTIKRSKPPNRGQKVRSQSVLCSEARL